MLWKAFIVFCLSNFLCFFSNLKMQLIWNHKSNRTLCSTYIFNIFVLGYFPISAISPTPTNKDGCDDLSNGIATLGTNVCSCEIVGEISAYQAVTCAAASFVSEEMKNFCQCDCEVGHFAKKSSQVCSDIGPTGCPCACQYKPEDLTSVQRQNPFTVYRQEEPFNSSRTVPGKYISSRTVLSTVCNVALGPTIQNICSQDWHTFSDHQTLSAEVVCDIDCLCTHCADKVEGKYGYCGQVDDTLYCICNIKYEL